MLRSEFLIIAPRVSLIQSPILLNIFYCESNFVLETFKLNKT